MQEGQSPTPKVVDRRIRWTRTKDSVVWINISSTRNKNNKLVLRRHNRTQRMMETCGPQQNDKEQTKSGNLNDAGCRLHLQTPDYNSLSWFCNASRISFCLSSSSSWVCGFVMVVCRHRPQIQNSWEQKFVVWSTGHVRLQLVTSFQCDLLLGRPLNA